MTIQSTGRSPGFRPITLALPFQSTSDLVAVRFHIKQAHTTTVVAHHTFKHTVTPSASKTTTTTDMSVCRSIISPVALLRHFGSANQSSIPLTTACPPAGLSADKWCLSHVCVYSITPTQQVLVRSLQCEPIHRPSRLRRYVRPWAKLLPGAEASHQPSAAHSI